MYGPDWYPYANVPPHPPRRWRWPEWWEVGVGIGFLTWVAALATMLLVLAWGAAR